jgi:hypothetical protein
MSTHDITETGIEVGLRELDRRRNDGVEVTLYWEPRTDRVFVAVEDEHRGASFRFEAAAARALEAFHHPYAFAPREDGELRVLEVLGRRSRNRVPTPARPERPHEDLDRLRVAL